MQDGPVRTALYEKLYRMAGDFVPWIFGLHRQEFILQHAWLKNYIYSDFEMHVESYLNIDMKKKAEMLSKFF